MERPATQKMRDRKNVAVDTSTGTVPANSKGIAMTEMDREMMATQTKSAAVLARR